MSYFFEQRFQFVFQLKCDVGILGSIFIHLFGRQVTHTLLAFSPRTYQFINMNGLVVEVCLSHDVHVVTQLRLDEIMRNHGVPQTALKFDAVVGEHLHVVLDVLSHLENVGMFIHRTENLDYLLSLCPVFWHRNIKCLMLFH